MWAGLLATASQRADSVSPSFAETLKQLTPDEARHLEHVVGKTIELYKKPRLTPETQVTPYAFTERWEAPPGVSSDTFERLGLIRRDYDVDLRWPKSESVEEALDKLKTEVGYTFVFTKYAVRFLEACHGPLFRKMGDSSQR
jgi:hypothetical protein